MPRTEYKGPRRSSPEPAGLVACQPGASEPVSKLPPFRRWVSTRERPLQRADRRVTEEGARGTRVVSRRLNRFGSGHADASFWSFETGSSAPGASRTSFAYTAVIGAGVSLPAGLAAADLMYGGAFQPSEALKALTYFEGGDLDALSGDTRATLIAAARGVDELPDVRFSSRRLSVSPTE